MTFVEEVPQFTPEREHSAPARRFPESPEGTMSKLAQANPSLNAAFPGSAFAGPPTVPMMVMNCTWACRKVSYDIKHLQTLNTFRHLTPALSGGHRRRHGCGPHTNA